MMELYETSQSLMPNVSDALNTHDAAHKLGSASLHEVALKLLSMHQLGHIATDELDADVVTDSDWDKIPSAICLEQGAGSILGRIDSHSINNARFVSAEHSIMDAVSGISPKDVLTSFSVDTNHKLRDRIPVYDVWLIKKDKPTFEKTEQNIKCGKFVDVGYPRKSGAYKFPVYAQEVSDDYEFFQVHKHGDDVTIFDRSGKEKIGMAETIDRFVAMDEPVNAVFECIMSDDTPYIFDILSLDGIDMTGVALSAKMDIVKSYSGKWTGLIGMQEVYTINDSRELCNIPKGNYIIRHTEDVMSDMLRPFWFFYEAGIVRPGTPLPWVSVGETVEVDKYPANKIVVKYGNAPRMQIHKDNRGIYLFVAEGGRNRITSFPQLNNVFSGINENFIIECMVDIEDADGLPVSSQRIMRPNADLSKCNIKLHAYDVAFWGDDVSSKPMFERVEMLESIISGIESELIDYSYDTPIKDGVVLVFDEMNDRLAINSNSTICEKLCIR